MDNLQFYVLFKGDVRLIMEGCCNGALFMVEKISPKVGIELGPLDQ